MTDTSGNDAIRAIASRPARNYSGAIRMASRKLFDLRSPFPDDFDQLPDAELSRLATAEVWGSASIYDDLRTLVDTVEGATAEQRCMYALQFCDSEICNGGFHQLLWNPTGILVPWALDGLARMDAHAYLRLYRQALARLPDGERPADHDEAQAALELVPPSRFRPINDAYYALHRNPESNLYALTARHVRAAPDAFFRRPLSEPSEPDANSPAGAPKAYSPTGRYVVGDRIEHAKFGSGKVVAVGRRQVEVVFADGARKLASG